jgi:hypothetical protein
MAHGEAFLELLNVEAVLEPGVVPAPDLLFSHAGKRIGIEHTRISVFSASIKQQRPTSFPQKPVSCFS